MNSGMSVKYQDYYEALEVTRSASTDEIQRAYRGLARKYHPDVNKAADAAEKFNRISEAYEVLKDADKRKQYDTLGPNWNAGQDFRAPPGFEDFQFTFRGKGTGNSGFSFSPDGFSDFFEMMFGQGPHHGNPNGTGPASESPFVGARPKAGAADMQSFLSVTVREALTGVAKNISVKRDAGIQKQTPLEVKIPAGVTHGSKIRLRGQGRNGGDLILTIQITPDSDFSVDGHDVTTELRLSPWEAALGTTVAVATLEDHVEINIPPGTTSGRRLRLRGRGVPKSQDPHRGDLFVRIQIVVPKKLTAIERKIYEKMKEESKFNPRDIKRK